MSDTKEEITTDSASTKLNSRNSRPTSEGKNEIGTKTETSTAVVAMTAKKHLTGAQYGGEFGLALGIYW